MRRIVLIIAALIIPLIFFSFLARTEYSREKTTLFVDQTFPEGWGVAREIERELKSYNTTATVRSFEPENLNAFIISDPGSLFITNAVLDSELFPLDERKYSSVAVAVSRKDGEISNISGDVFQSIPEYEDSITLKKLEKGKIDLGTISFYRLNLDVKPLTIDGIYPSVRTIRSGEYPWVRKARIFGQQDNPLLKIDLFTRPSEDRMENVYTIIAGGDIMLSRGTAKYIDLFGTEYPFLNIKEEISGHDIACANLESPLSIRGERFSPNKGIYFRANPKAAAGLQYSGIDVLSLANNHAFDWGVNAILDTMNILESRGIVYAGVGRTERDAVKPAVVNVGGANIAFYSANGIYPFEVSGKAGSVMRTGTIDSPSFKKSISEGKDLYDVIFLLLHTGEEYLQFPESEKVTQMHRLIDMGIDVVLGSHPHVIQALEVYNEGLIAYSLGNLIFDQNWSEETSRGMLLEMGFLQNNILYYRPRLVYIDSTQARIVSDADSKSILSKLTTEYRSHEYAQN